MMRIGIALCIIWDQLRLWDRGLLEYVYRHSAHGGFTDRAKSWYVLDSLFGDEHAGIIAWALTVISMVFVALGVRARIFTVLGCFMYSQLAYGFWIAETSGDRIARIGLVLLLFTTVHQTWSLERPAQPATTTMAWPVDLARWFLFLIYINAGLCKVFPRPLNWLGWHDTAVTYRILTYPLTSRLDAAFWYDWKWTWYLSDVATIIVECSAILLLTRWRKWWALAAAPIHIGIFLFMEIDFFGAVMLAWYPLLFDEWIIEGLDRLKRKA
jgi:hypothetical protein